jgi:MFS family permease
VWSDARACRTDRIVTPNRSEHEFGLRSWSDPAVVAVAFMALASGFGQFGAVAALGDVAQHFGRVVHGNSIADQAGLSATELGVGLAILRLASLGGLPLAGLADRIGRRTVLVSTCALGLAFTVLAALSPGYWWFVVIFALGRPLLSATNAVAQVSAAEETASSDRAKAIALIAAGYGVGTGLTAVINGLWKSTLGFRGLFALSVVPLAAIFFIQRWLVESGRFKAVAVERPNRVPAGWASGSLRAGSVPVFGAIAPPYRRRLGTVASIAFAVGVVTGPANSFIFVYAQNVLKISGAVTAAMVVVASVFGLSGLLLGRVLADRFGRRPTGAVAMLAMAITGVFTYSGSKTALLVGYELAVFCASTFAPAAGALANELFPTSVRASVAGWNVAASVLGAVVGLVAFGAIAEVGNRFAVGAEVTFLPVILATALFGLLPETRGREPEDLWPEEA